MTDQLFRNNPSDSLDPGSVPSGPSVMSPEVLSTPTSTPQDPPLDSSEWAPEDDEESGAAEDESAAQATGPELFPSNRFLGQLQGLPGEGRYQQHHSCAEW